MTSDPATESKAQSAQSSEIALLWRRYLACRDGRSHDQLLRAVDRLIRLEAKRMLVSHSYLAEEAAQEALLGVERKIGSLEAPEYPAAFIRKVLSNKVATILQRESRRKAREERNWSPEVPDENITTSTEWHEFLGTLRTAVNDDEFWTLVLHYHFDFSYDEIGELLEKEAGTIRQIALRGRRKCRQSLTRLEGRVPAWFGLPDPPADQWRLIDPEDMPDLQGDGSSSGNEQMSNNGTSEYSTPSDAPGWPPEIAAKKAGEWGQDISDSADGLRRASIGSDSSAPREPKTTSRRFGQLTVHVGTATSRLEGVGRRWLCTAPSSILPLVALVAVPALAFFPDADASAGVQSTSSEPNGPTITVREGNEPVIAGGGSAGADRAGRQDLVERPSDQSPTGPAQSPTTDAIEPAPAERVAGSSVTGPTVNGPPVTGGESQDEQTSTPDTFFDQAVPPAGPAVPLPTTEPASTSTTGDVPHSSTDTSPTDVAPTDTAPSTAPPTSDTPPTSAVSRTTAAPATTDRATTTNRAATTAPTTIATTTTTTTAPTTTAPTTTTLRTTTLPQTTRSTTTTQQTTTTTAPATTTEAKTTTTTQATTTTSASSTTTEQTTTTQPTTTTEQTTTTQPTTTTTEPPATSTSEPSPAF